MNYEDTAALIVDGIVWLEVSVYLVGDSVFFYSTFICPSAPC